MNEKFYNEIKNILNMARNKVYKTANFAMVEAYWNIGKSIIEEQGGNEKAEYGTGLLKELSKQMTQDFGKGFTVTNLKYMRQFYLVFPNGHALRDELSWTHYRLLIKVENDNAREFYMQEAVKSQWSTRQLERQINSFFYERLLSSKNKEQVATEIQTLELAKKPEDVIRDPYVLEFLGLTPNDDFYESDLEQALITHLQKFLLELGRGFSFVARQKRITFDGRHFRIDNNPDFKPLEFEGFRKQAGANAFTMSPKKWIEATDAIGIVSKSGRYGGTYAHSDIAMSFATWISPEFQLYIMKDYRRLKTDENSRLSLNWNLNREISKLNYRIHTDAIKDNLIPAELTPAQIAYTYANEADMLNVVLFGKTAKQWKDEKDEGYIEFLQNAL